MTPDSPNDLREDIAGAIYNATGLRGAVWAVVSDVADEYALADAVMPVVEVETAQLRATPAAHPANVDDSALIEQAAVTLAWGEEDEAQYYMDEARKIYERVYAPVLAAKDALATDLRAQWEAAEERERVVRREVKSLRATGDRAAVLSDLLRAMARRVAELRPHVWAAEHRLGLIKQFNELVPNQMREIEQLRAEVAALRAEAVVIPEDAAKRLDDVGFAWTIEERHAIVEEVRSWRPATEISVGDRVEWNPQGDRWEPGVVTGVNRHHLVIVLDDNGQSLTVERRHVRRAVTESRAAVCGDEDIEDGLRYVCQEPAGHAGKHPRLFVGPPRPATEPAEMTGGPQWWWVTCCEAGQVAYPGPCPWHGTDGHPATPATKRAEATAPRVFRKGDPEPSDINQVKDDGDRRWCRNRADRSWYLRDIAGPFLMWDELLDRTGLLTEVPPGGGDRDQG